MSTTATKQAGKDETVTTFINIADLDADDDLTVDYPLVRTVAALASTSALAILLGSIVIWWVLR